MTSGQGENGPRGIRAKHAYTPFFCEENVWHLAQGVVREGSGVDASVVFITNAGRKCALWNQRAAPSASRPVVWDYHVVLMVQRGPWEVWDLDTRLEMPLALESYLAGTFPMNASIGEDFRPRFRVVDATVFLREFGSDRSHMRAADGSWLAPPPPWPMIGQAGSKPNLAAFIDLESNAPGEILDLDALRTKSLLIEID